MGSGASIDMKDTERSPAETKLLEVIHDKNLLGKFFKEVALSHAPNKKKGNDFNINQTNVTDFYTYNLKSEFHVIFEVMGEKKLDLIVLGEAFKFSKPSKKGYIVPKQWTSFLRSIYHISMLYSAFHSVDNFICDGRIFMNEFKTLTKSLESVAGIEMKINATDEEVMAEFAELDVNKDNNITFAELCKYAKTKIHSPELEDEISTEEDDQAEQEAAAAAAEAEEQDALTEAGGQVIEAAEGEATVTAGGESTATVGAGATVAPEGEVVVAAEGEVVVAAEGEAT